MRRLVPVLLVLVLFAPACASKVPPNLTPAATAAWYGTQAIKGLDLLRDTAISANATMPPLLPEATTRKVVLYHESAIKIIHEAPNGWKAAVSTGLDELRAQLSDTDRALLGPYLALAKTALQEIP